MKANGGFTVQRGGAMKRKVEAAEPADIHSVYDSGGQTIDRYTIVMKWPEPGGLFMALGLSDNPDSPQGFSQFSAAKVGPHLGRQIAFQDLPQNVQEHAVRRLSSKEVRSQGGLHLGPGGVVDSIHDASMLLPKALEYARDGDSTTSLVMCRAAADFLATAINLLEQATEIG